MADFGINPNIALGFQAPKTQSIGDLVGTAKGLMEFQKLSELYPAIIEQTKAQSRGAVATARSQELANTSAVYGKIAASQIGMYHDPLVVAAEEAVAKNKPLTEEQKTALVQKVTQNAKTLVSNLGLPWESNDPTVPSGKSLSAEYVETAMNNPGGLRTLYGQKAMSLLQPSEMTAQLHGELVTGPDGQPAIFNRATGTLSPARYGQGGNVPPAGQTALGVAPGTSASASVPAPGGVTAADMTRRPVSAPSASPSGMPLTQALPAIRFPNRPAGSVMPIRPEEKSARDTGTAWYNSQLAAREELSTARRDVDQVISGATQLQDGIIPSTGFWAKLKKSAAELQGDPEYQMLNKSLAGLAIRTSAALGGASANTQGGQSLVQASLGTETYDPSVLKKIAQNVGADLTHIDLRTSAADQFVSRFGEANVGAFRTAWANHANPTVFKAINISRDAANPDEANALIQGMMKGMSQKKREQFAENYRAIKSMVAGEFGPYLRKR